MPMQNTAWTSQPPEPEMNKDSANQHHADRSEDAFWHWLQSQWQAMAAAH